MLQARFWDRKLARKGNMTASSEGNNGHLELHYVVKLELRIDYFHHIAFGQPIRILLVVIQDAESFRFLVACKTSTTPDAV